MSCIIINDSYDSSIHFVICEEGDRLHIHDHACACISMLGD